MEIVEVNLSHADIVGKVHSEAWKDTYKNIFSLEYVNQDKSENRTQECRAALNRKRSKYYLIIVENIPAGIIKISLKTNVCEIESLYFLGEYRGCGYGKQTIEFIIKEYSKCTIILWVLEQNFAAVGFYEKLGFSSTDEKRIVNRGQDYYQVKYVYQNSI